MGETTGIAWTDATWNPWIGCMKVHEGCRFCYAEADMDHRKGRAEWGPTGTRSMTSFDYWKQPMKWNADAEKSGMRRKVFCASLCDVFEDWRGRIINHEGKKLSVYSGNGGVVASFPETAEPPNCDPLTMAYLRKMLFNLIDRTPNLDWQLLTKRPENIQRMWPSCSRCKGNGRIEMLEHCPQCGGKPLCPRRENVWLGTSISDQDTADKAVPHLIQCRDIVPILFLSAEPLLGPIDLQTIRDNDRFPGCAYFDVLRGRMIHEDDGNHWTPEPHIDWVIVGGESGPNARPFDLAWGRNIVRQCKESSVPVFVKQTGSITVDSSMCEPDGTPGIILGMRDKKGGDMSEWEKELRVRQFPNPVSI